VQFLQPVTAAPSASVSRQTGPSIPLQRELKTQHLERYGAARHAGGDAYGDFRRNDAVRWQSSGRQAIGVDYEENIEAWISLTIYYEAN